MKTWLALAALTATSAAALAQAPAPPLPAILEKSCAACHANGKAKGKFGSVLDLAQMIQDKRIVPGSPNESGLFARLGLHRDMPPEDAPAEVARPTPADIKEVREFIEKLPPAAPPAGAKPPEPPAGARAVTPVTDAAVLAAIKADLDARDPADRPFQRYFTLHHLHNNPKFTDADLRLLRAAVGKLANSLSLKARIQVLRPVPGTQDAVLGIDLRQFDWDACNFWGKLAKAYPYLLSHGEVRDAKMAADFRDVRRMADTAMPAVRADWFAVNAARAPLYHTLLYETLLGLKGGSVSLQGKLLSGTRAMTDRDLEHYLKVDTQDDILRQKVARAGFGESGVSSQNRMVERHDMRFGAYWKSYDFLGKSGTDDLLQFPLGPKFAGNPFNDLAFEQAGGEIIFSLPNGLQAYLLVNGKGERIDAGPPDVVHDDNKISGKVEIVNAVSCMHCHARGNKSLQQPALGWLRDGHAARGAARLAVERLYPDEKTLRALFQEDQDRFLAAATKATVPFFKEGDKSLEPVGFVAVKLNVEELTLDAAAYELGFGRPDELKALIGGSEALQNLGLRPLAAGRTVKRSMWEGPAPGSTNSVFQEAASALDRGTPTVANR